MKRIFATCVVATATIAAGSAFAQSGKTLAQIKARGFVSCGVNPGLAGFGLPDDKGAWTGLDVDLCRAITSAVFNDPNNVRFVPFTAKDRFTALQSGEIDVPIRNGTWKPAGR